MKAYSARAGPTRYLLLLGLIGLPQPSRAQAVQGRLLDLETRAPVEGALVLLLSPELEARGGSLTGADGRFFARAPAPGRYSLKFFRIGYETITSPEMELSPGEAVEIQLETRTAPIVLDELKVVADQRCVVRPEEGQELARVWEEAGKALTVQQWAEGQGLFQFRAAEIQREMDPGGLLILSEIRQEVQGVSSNPVRSLPAEELVDQGFIQPAGDERYDYFGPDASALLSDLFLDSHCFRFEVSNDSPDLIGLAFEPVRVGGPPDIRGTLWVDRESARLRFLEFRYDWAPWVEAADVARGRVEFQELRDGAWIIPRWWIRMPIMARGSLKKREPPDTVRLVGSLEMGWEVAEVSSLDGRSVVRGTPGSIRGLVVEGNPGRKPPQVTLAPPSTARAVPVKEDGTFLLDDVPEGGYGVSLRHPLLDSLGVSLRDTDVLVRGRRATNIRLEMPAREEILTALCNPDPGEPVSAVVTGTVRLEKTGEPVAGATVFLEWSEPDFWIFKKRRWTQVSSDETGRYRACGFPAETRVRVQASGRDLRTPIEEFRADPGQIVLLDVFVGSRGRSNSTPVPGG